MHSWRAQKNCLFIPRCVKNVHRPRRDQKRERLNRAVRSTCRRDAVIGALIQARSFQKELSDFLAQASPDAGAGGCVLPSPLFSKPSEADTAAGCGIFNENDVGLPEDALVPAAGFASVVFEIGPVSSRSLDGLSDGGRRDTSDPTSALSTVMSSSSAGGGKVTDLL